MRIIRGSFDLEEPGSLDMEASDMEYAIESASIARGGMTFAGVGDAAAEAPSRPPLGGPTVLRSSPKPAKPQMSRNLHRVYFISGRAYRNG